MGRRLTRKGRRLCYRVVNGRKRLRRCGCGGCCWCENAKAQVGEPCYTTRHDLCGPESCCCGVAWEARIRTTSHFEDTEKPDGYLVDAEIDLHVRRDVRKNDQGGCYYATAIYRDYFRMVGHNRFGIPFDFSTESAGLDNPGAFSLCRNTAYSAAWPLSQTYAKFGHAGGIFNSVGTDGFAKNECTGTIIDPPTVKSWTGGGDCKIGTWTWTFSADYGNVIRNASAGGSWEVKLIDADCCPKPDGPTLGADIPGFNPPGTPGTPGTPGGSPSSGGGCGGCGSDGGL